MADIQFDFFIMAKELNDDIDLHPELITKKAHFRGSFHSIALISLDEETPEIGKSFHSKETAKEGLARFNPQKPARVTPEKRLQAHIILHALNNGNKLPFGEDLTFISSEIAIVLENNKRIVNDILALDSAGNLVVIELKSIRVIEVKKQAIEFKKVIEDNKECFHRLTKLMTGQEWNGKIRCMVVWPEAKSKNKRACPAEYIAVEEYEYNETYEFCKIR